MKSIAILLVGHIRTYKSTFIDNYPPNADIFVHVYTDKFHKERLTFGEGYDCLLNL